MSQHRPVLQDHKRVGRTRFIPPIMAALGKVHDPRWVDNILPDLVWIQYLIRQFGFEQSAQLAVAIAQSGAKAMESEKKVWFAASSAHDLLPDNAKHAVVRELRAHAALEPVAEALLPLFTLHPQFPLAYLCHASLLLPLSKERCVTALTHVLQPLFDRRSRESTILQAHAVDISFGLDMLFISSSIRKPELNAILNDPDSDNARHAGGFVRNSTSALGGMYHETHSPAWPARFWSRNYELRGCYSNLGNLHEH